MTHKTQAQIKEARQKLGFTSSQMAEACGLNNGSMIRRFEVGETRIGRTTSFLIDILTGGIDPNNPDHDQAYECGLDSLDGPARMLIKLITGDIDLEAHLEAIRAKRPKRGRKKIQKDVDLGS